MTFNPRSVAGARFGMAAIAVAAWLIVLLPGRAVDLAPYLASWMLLAVSFSLAWMSDRHRHGDDTFLVAGLAFLAALGCMRQSAGGFASGVGILAIVPVVDAALYGRNELRLWVVLFGMALMLFVPIVFVGGVNYPADQYRSAILLVSVSAFIGIASQRLVRQVRREAESSRRSHSLLEEVSRVAHELFASQDVRNDLCLATRRISDASIAVLLEPVPGEAVMRLTAVAGVPGLQIDLPLTSRNPVGGTFLDGSRRLIDLATSDEVASAALWRDVGSPASLLYQPLIRDGETIAVLVVGWAQPASLGGSRTAIVDLLAHEAALVLDRADQVSALADLAQTDPLTGLPNRRAWDGRTELALHDDESLAIVMFDIDHFKHFNDQYGHPAGDRLLRETAAAWCEQLRPGDLLARLGGEEFGLLLGGRDVDHVLEVTERLRRVVAGGQTCSAGIAVRRPGEPIESVIGRADQALYDAKAGGRDHARAAA